jgi:hypothetical protein
MDPFPSEIIQIVGEFKEERVHLKFRSTRALQNMLAYCQARVEQLDRQNQYLEHKVQQQYDLQEIMAIWKRLEHAQLNLQRFSQRCLLIKLELVYRDQLFQESVRGR